MYKINKLEANYSYTSTVITPNGNSSTYKKRESISVLPNLIEGMDFTLHGAKEESIDGNPLKNFDAIISQLAQAIYPIELNILANGIIKSVNNFEEIKERWQKESSNILSIYKKANIVIRYINIVSRNMSNEQLFLKAFIRGSFTSLLFLEEGIEIQKIILYDFPYSGNTTEPNFQLTKQEKREYTYQSLPQENDSIFEKRGELYCQYSSKGLPIKIALKYMIENEREGFHTKHIELNLLGKNKKKRVWEKNI